MLYRVVNSSIGCPENSIAAANAITILKVMKVSFSCLDLQGVQIPGANLSSAILDRADLSGANLEAALLTNTSLNSTDMSRAKLKDVKFDMPKVIIHEDIVLSTLVSPDKNYLVSEDRWYIYFWHLPSKTNIKKIEKERPRSSVDHLRFSEKIFTPDGQFLFIFDGNQNIDICLVKGSIKHFEKIQSLETIHQNEIRGYFHESFGEFVREAEAIYFTFSSNGKYFITCRIEQDIGLFKNHLRIWEIQKTENDLLNFNLKNDVTTLNYRSKFCFSEKFPAFYCFEKEININLYLRMYYVDKLPDISNDKELSNCFVDIFITSRDISKYGSNETLSLGILDTKKNNEELLFIGVDNSIYSVSIFGKNERNWSLESSQVIKIITEVDGIFSMKVLKNTHELLYICKDTICLYSINNNQLIGKFRLLDTKLKEVSVFSDEVSIYVNSSNKVFIYSVEALKNSKYISYDTDKAVASFSPDMRSIISISNNYDMQIYNIENGNMLRSKPLQRLKSLVSKGNPYKISLSRNNQHILISHDSKAQDSNVGHFVHIINAENEKTFLEIPTNINEFALSGDSKYLAITNNKNIVEIYKTTPSKQCIGQFIAEHRYLNRNNYFDSPSYPEEYKIISSKQSNDQFRVKYYNVDSIVISTDFRKTLRMILNLKFSISTLTILLNFTFRDEEIELLSQKTLKVRSDDQGYDPYLQFFFIENDNKLIVTYTRNMVIWDIDNDQYEEYKIQASCADVSHDESLFIYYSRNGQPDSAIHQLCLWSLPQKKLLFVQALAFAITKLQISSDNRYILGTVENEGIYVWKILEDAFRLLWRTSHDLQAQGLILGDNNLEKDAEEDFITKMGALKL